ncbi:hypothetical protein [Calothrix sp. CCY 0018]|uniref:hypothetical protein n=1 Tax=Calothrix sp. CCY 0018 TaxID=3103864 RepID=UPI0039C63422
MSGIEGRTGKPGVSNPKKKNDTSFKVEGKEARSQKPICFRPTLTVEAQIEAAVKEAGITKTKWLEQAAIAYLNQNET